MTSESLLRAVCMLLLGGLIAVAIRLHSRKPEGLIVLAVVVAVLAAIRAGGLFRPLLLLPAVGTPALLMLWWRMPHRPAASLTPATSKAPQQATGPTVALAAVLLPALVLFREAMIAGPGLGWVACGLATCGVFEFGVRRDAVEYPLQQPHPFLWPLTVFGALLLIVESRVWHTSGGPTRIGLWWLGALLLLGLRSEPRDQSRSSMQIVARRLGPVLMGGQMLLAIAAMLAEDRAGFAEPGRLRQTQLGQTVVQWLISPSYLVVALVPVSLALFIMALGHATTGAERSDRVRLLHAMLASLAGVIVAVVAAISTLQGNPFVASTERLDVLALRWGTGTTLWILAGGLATLLASLVATAWLWPSDERPAGGHRWGLAIALLASQPAFPLGVCWWIALSRVVVLPLPNNLGAATPQPAAVMVAALILIGPLATLPAMLRAIAPARADERVSTS